jgi:5-methylcytosine-specific restriction enzyme subunit McrC
MSIPIANLYYLLAYASDVLPVQGYANIGTEPTAKVQDLFARLLINETNILLRRGFDQGYLEEFYDSEVIRGRIDFAESVRRSLLIRRVVSVCVAELTHDILHNQILKSTLLDLAGVIGLDADLKRQLLLTAKALPGIHEIELSEQVFRRVQLGTNTRTYRFLMDVCAIVYESLLPDEATGSHRFRDFLREDGPMAKLWEKFLLNFYRRHAEAFRVQAKNLSWQASGPGVASMLPQMRTDVWLEGADRIIVIDAKYYAAALERDRWDGSRLKLKPNHVNQMFAYLSNAKVVTRGEKAVYGVLLYPLVDTAVAADEKLHDFTLRARTIDLRSHWTQIEASLLKVLVANLCVTPLFLIRIF